MQRTVRWAAAIGLALASGGCVDLGDDLADAIARDTASALTCDLQTSSEGFDPTDGEGTLHAPPFSPSSPEVVARGAHVTVTVVYDGARPALTADGEGGVEVIDAEATYCERSEGDADASDTTHWVVAMTVADPGDVVLFQDGAPLTRWRPDVRDVASIALTLDDPEACAVDATCLVRAELLDAGGAPLYAEEDFAWTIDGAADAGPFGSWLQIRPTAAGSLHIEATVLGQRAALDVEVPG